MTANGWLQIAFFSLVVLALTKPLGAVHPARVRRHDALAAAGGARHLPGCAAWTRPKISTGRATPRAC